MNTSTKNLFFLLSAAPMGMAGCVLDLDPFDSALATLSTETGSGDGDGDTGDGDGDTGDGDGDTGDGDGDGDGDSGDGDGDTGDGDGDTGDGDGDTGDGDGDGDNACAAYGATAGECYDPTYVEYATTYCEQSVYYASMVSVECGTATEAIFACLSTLSCEDFLMDPPPGCEAEIAAAEGVCGGG